MSHSPSTQPQTGLLVPQAETRADKRALLLVVERDPHVRALEKFFLEEAGFTVEFTEDGQHGLERARELVPEIVISEILLPGTDGLSICRILKADPLTRHVRVLLFSILSAADRAQEAGADAFLRKPVDSARLVHSVKLLLAPRGNG